MRSACSWQRKPALSHRGTCRHPVRTSRSRAPWMGRVLPETFGRYRIVRPLGEGGMGSVYLAHDTQLDRLVALKVPRLGDEEQPAPHELARFFREARAAASLSHPNLCPIHDVGEIDGTPYLTMA